MIHISNTDPNAKFQVRFEEGGAINNHPIRIGFQKYGGECFFLSVEEDSELAKGLQDAILAYGQTVIPQTSQEPVQTAQQLIENSNFGSMTNLVNEFVERTNTV